MFVVAIYDISNNTRRTRLFKALNNFGTPVQYSAFECILNKKELKKMQEVVRKIINAIKTKSVSTHSAALAGTQLRIWKLGKYRRTGK